MPVRSPEETAAVVEAVRRGMELLPEIKRRRVIGSETAARTAARTVGVNATAFHKVSQMLRAEAGAPPGPVKTQLQAVIDELTIGAINVNAALEAVLDIQRQAGIDQMRRPGDTRDQLACRRLSDSVAALVNACNAAAHIEVPAGLDDDTAGVCDQQISAAVRQLHQLRKRIRRAGS